ncbi:uncharacterized protein LOC135712823 [Ochlerotatus camptorhynchus]|uniref:uncharacterized protein LOC135712823 n=1 Tax=Ochlerotatus camptorhynchus TaxID=644619 RepID=UPI0031D06BF6
MDLNIQQQQQQESDKIHCYCFLCFTEKSSATEEEIFIAIRGEEGVRRNVGTLVQKYFIEESLTVEGFVCGSCCQQLESFHRFYLRIKELQWNRKMRSAEVGDRIRQTEEFQLEMNIKEEKLDEGYNFDQTSDVDGLSNFLNEQFRTQPDHNGNGLQNRLLDSIVNEFQASSLSGTDSLECGSDQPFSKRMKRNLTDAWQVNHQNEHPSSNTPNPELEFLDEEYYEYDKPPDERSDQAQSSSAASPFEELERLRRENDWLKRHNHQLVVRLKEVRVRNTDLVKINRELTDKLRSYNPNALMKAVPSINDHVNTYPMPTPTVNIKQLPMSPSPSTSTLSRIPPQLQQQPKQEQNVNKFVLFSGAYTLDNGDVVVRDSLIPCTVMMDIDSIEQGEKYDLKFVSKLAVALWGHERLAVSSVTGRKSNNAGSNATPSVQLEPEKLSFIKEKVYNRAMRETNDRVQAMARFDDSRINRLLNIKIQNAKRKKNLNFSAV